MYIPKIRRMVDAIQEIKSIDPETALTYRYIRTMVEKKKVTTITQEEIDFIESMIRPME